MAGVDNRRSEQPIGHDAKEQKDRDHDRRNKVSHRFPCKEDPIIRLVSGHNTA